MIEPAKTIAEYNPLSFIVEGIREPIISGHLDAPTTLEAVLGDRRHRRRSGSCSAPAPCATG